MKFDVVVGNPPYQSSQHNLRDRLWMQFVDNAFNRCTDGGYVAMITPASWCHEAELYERWFASKSPVYINIDQCACFFPGVGSTFSWYVIHNHSPCQQLVTIQTATDVTQCHLPSVPFGSHPMSGQILDKLIHSPHNRLTAFSKSSHHTSKNYGKYSADPHPDFPIPVIKSISRSAINYGWGRVVDPTLDTPRVIAFTMTNGWLDGDPFRVVTVGQTNESFVHLPTPTIEQAEVLKQVLSSKVFKFAVKTLNSNRTVRAASIRSLPAVDLTRSWTDKELYAHFNLTQEEIDLIESTVK